MNLSTQFLTQYLCLEYNITKTQHVHFQTFDSSNLKLIDSYCFVTSLNGTSICSIAQVINFGYIFTTPPNTLHQHHQQIH